MLFIEKVRAGNAGRCGYLCVTDHCSKYYSSNWGRIWMWKLEQIDLEESHHRAELDAKKRMSIEHHIENSIVNGNRMLGFFSVFYDHFGNDILY